MKHGREFLRFLYLNLKPTNKHCKKKQREPCFVPGKPQRAKSCRFFVKLGRVLAVAPAKSASHATGHVAVISSLLAKPATRSDRRRGSLETLPTHGLWAMEDAYLDLKLVATKYLKRIGAISERFLEVPGIIHV